MWQNRVMQGGTAHLHSLGSKHIFHFRLKPSIWPEKHLALGRIPKPKPKVQIYVKIGGILLKFNVSTDLSNYVSKFFLYNLGNLFKLT